jgi:hypothetical protein
VVVAERNDEAYWLDQLTVLSGPRSAVEHGRPRSNRPERQWRDRRDRAKGVPDQ